MRRILFTLTIAVTLTLCLGVVAAGPTTENTSFPDQVIGPDDQVVVEGIDENDTEIVAVTTTVNGSNILVGSNNGSNTVEIQNQTGLPGDHTVHLFNETEVDDGNGGTINLTTVDVGSPVSTTVADQAVFNQTTNLYSNATLDFNREGTEGDIDEVTVSEVSVTSDENVTLAVFLHPEEDGEMNGSNIIGDSKIVQNQAENLTVELDDGETVPSGERLFAMIHLVDGSVGDDPQRDQPALLRNTNGSLSPVVDSTEGQGVSFTSVTIPGLDYDVPLFLVAIFGVIIVALTAVAVYVRFGDLDDIEYQS